MDFNILDDVIEKFKKGNKILFNRNSLSLRKLLELIRKQDHKTLVLWSFINIENLQNSVELTFPSDTRVADAVNICKKWSAGDEKMLTAKKALLKVHSMAKETDDPVIIAKLHAIGQGLATIHVETHAIGLAFYELTSIVLECGVDNCYEKIINKIQNYIDTLEKCSIDINQNNYTWASFLLKSNMPNKEELLYQKQIIENNIILHIPHANVFLPEDMGELLIDKESLIAFSKDISDIKVNELFSHKIGIKYTAPYSRVYCDVEKYIDDQEEIMSQYGQGVFYTKDSKGNEIRRINSEYKERVRNDYYLSYHKGLDDLTLSMLDKKLIILDCHSFSEENVLHNKSDKYSDIDLGFSEQYYSKELLNGIRKIFEKNGYTVSYNHPYEGTLIPNIIYGKNISNVFCLMIEINKRIYLSNKETFLKCKSTIKEVLTYIKYF